jgi:hypothetical protein
MDYRKRLIGLIYKLWKRRNYYKYWMDYHQKSNAFWHQHFDAMTAEEEDK